MTQNSFTLEPHAFNHACSQTATYQLTAAFHSQRSTLPAATPMCSPTAMPIRLQWPPPGLSPLPHQMYLTEPRLRLKSRSAAMPMSPYRTSPPTEKPFGRHADVTLPSPASGCKAVRPPCRCYPAVPCPRLSSRSAAMPMCHTLLYLRLQSRSAAAPMSPNLISP